MPLHPLILAFAAGTIIAPWLHPDAVTLAMLGALLPGSAWCARRGDRAGRIGAALLCFGIGMAFTLAHASWWLQQRLPADEDVLERTITGTVVSFPREAGGLVRVRLRLEHPVLPARTATPGLFYGTVQLNCYRCRLRFAPGQRWRITARLRGIHGLANPYLFDYERWAFAQRLVARGNVVGTGDHRLLSDDPPWLTATRVRLDRFLDQAGSTASAMAILRAVVLGIRDDIDDDAWRVFRRTGTSHLVAISGLHVGLVFGFFLFGFKLAARGCPPLLRHLAAQRLAVVAALPPTVVYAALAGFTLPTQRALVMLAVASLAFVAGRRVIGWPTFNLALGAVLLLDPLASLSAGFWLSFGAVAAIILVMTRPVSTREPEPSSVGARWWAALRRLLAGWVRVQLAVSLVVLPLSVAFFGDLPLLSPLVNLVAIPWFSIAVVPPAMLGVLAWMTGAETASASLLGLATWSTTTMTQALAGLAALPFAALRCDPVDLARVLLLLVVVVACMPGYRRCRPLAAAALALWLAVSHPRVAEGEFTVVVLDVGQGLAVVVRTRAHVLVFDTGVRYGSGFDMGAVVVAPYLSRTGVEQLHTLVISHGDRDHAGGRNAVAATFPPAVAYASEAGRQGPDRACVDGGHWAVDGVVFRFLAPTDISRRRHNDRSCVLSVRSRFGHALLPGDVEAAGEASLVRRHADTLAADLLVVAHHGSASSTTPAFLAAVSPRLAVVSRGLHNPHGHPHADVVGRLDEAGVRLLDTARDGAVQVHFDADGVRVATRRGEYQPPWASGAGRMDHGPG